MNLTLFVIRSASGIENPPVMETFKVYDRGSWKEAKMCVQCGRQFTWRKKWERCWSDIVTCSDKCKNDRKQSKKGSDSSTEKTKKGHNKPHTDKKK